MERIDKALGRFGPWVGYLAAFILGAVLLIAAFAKGLDPALFADGLGKLGFVPQSLTTYAALGAVAFEAALGLALVLNIRTKPVLAITLLTFVFFTAVVIREMYLPASEQSSCGCFGNLVERTPRQALIEDLIFVVLSLVAFVGRRAPVAGAPAPRWHVPAIGFGAAAGLAFCLASPHLPLDNLATRLKPGISIEAVKVGDQALDNRFPEAQVGRHLILLLDRSRDDEATKQAMERVNRILVNVDTVATHVWGLAEENEELAGQFFWVAAPTFEIRSVPLALLRPMYRTLPRAALIVDKQVIKVWNEIPDEATLQALARGENP